jgi:MFS family permease
VGEALRGRDFRLLVASSALSSMGDELALIAMTLKVAGLTHSGIDVAALLLAGLLPLVIFAPAAGVIVDNFETTRTLAIASALQALFAVGLAFSTGMPAILLLAFLLGTGTAVANPSLFTLVPTVVGEAHATEANAYMETARYVGMIAGPVLAGTITHSAGAKVALLVDGGTFVVIALSAMALTARRRPQASSEEGEEQETRTGIEIVRRDAVLVAAFTIYGAVILFAAMDNVAEVFFAQNDLKADGWGYGLLASMWILGMAGGASFIARKLPSERLAPALMASAVVGGAALVAAAGIAKLWPAAVLFVVGGVANGVESVSMRSVIVHRVADRSRGRVFAAYSGLANSLLLVATAVAGWLVVRLDGRATLIIGGIGSAIAGLAGLAWYRLLPADVRMTPGTTREGALRAIEVPESEVVVRLPESEAARGTSPDP